MLVSLLDSKIVANPEDLMISVCQEKIMLLPASSKHFFATFPKIACFTH
jgi:hypothetical protein